MTAPTYFDHYARQTTRDPGDTVELDPYLVLEGDAAGETIRRYFDAAVRTALAAGDAP